MRRRIVFFDVDGTLIDCAQGMNCILDSTVDAIKRLRESGHLVVLATGRSKSFLNDSKKVTSSNLLTPRGS